MDTLLYLRYYFELKVEICRARVRDNIASTRRGRDLKREQYIIVRLNNNTVINTPHKLK